MPEPERYQETMRRPLLHGALGAVLFLTALLVGFRGLVIAIGVLGGLLLLGSLWGFLRNVLGRADHIVLSDEAVDYVHPLKPERNRNVPLEQVQDVALDVGKIGRVKEQRIILTLKDGSTWTFGERFMEARRLEAFLQDIRERMSRL